MSLVGNIRRVGRGESARIISDVGNAINSISVVMLSVDASSSGMNGSWILDCGD